MAIFGELFVNEDKVSEVIGSTSDPVVRNLLNMALGRLIVTTQDHQRLDGHSAQGQQPLCPVDVHFVLVALSEMFHAKGMLIDILTGKRNTNDELL